MNQSILAGHRGLLALVGLVACCALAFVPVARAQVVTNDPPFYGPYNAVFLPDGEGLKKPLAEHDSVLRADSPWSLYCWMRTAEPLQAPELLAGIGDTSEEYPRYLALDVDKLVLWMGADNSLTASAGLAPAKWHLLAATFDGKDFSLYSDGALAATGKLDLGSVSPVLQMAPAVSPLPNARHFGGKISGLTLVRRALDAGEIKQLYQRPDDFSLLEFEEGSKPWPVQTRAQAGYRAPQDPSTMPTSRAPFSKPVVRNLPAQAALQPDGENQWTLAGGWSLTAAPNVKAGGAGDRSGWVQHQRLAARHHSRHRSDHHDRSRRIPRP